MYIIWRDNFSSTDPVFIVQKVSCFFPRATQKIIYIFTFTHIFSYKIYDLKYFLYCMK